MSPRAKDKSAERRRTPRVALKLPVDYSAVDAFFTEFSSNINEGGMFIETEEPPTLGTPVQLHFRLPGLARPLLVEGTVAWISDGKGEGGESAAGMGIEFGELPAEAREAINEVVRNLRAR